MCPRKQKCRIRKLLIQEGYVASTQGWYAILPALVLEQEFRMTSKG